ncbi:hypothetical protein [Mycobacterium simiae]|uniref:hypothetical protein n=1 Tax=Mycobacterium simiae TaxID=1784 RepID=UPI0012DE7644|nr:hypothetical protein [Mycobacterium simiae]BBX39802.1 hypothetical protein MSIM_12530 [Mycobacterium simiae]
MTSEVTVAFIGGGAGLLTGAITGTISSLIAPRANWGIEQRRLRRESRVQRITEWRAGVTELREAKPRDGKRVHYRKPLSLGDSITGRPAREEYIDAGVPSPDYVNVFTKPWFRTLKRELSPATLTQIDTLTERPLADRIGELPNMLDEEVNRLERDKWRLV